MLSVAAHCDVFLALTHSAYPRGDQQRDPLCVLVGGVVRAEMFVRLVEFRLRGLRRVPVRLGWPPRTSPRAKRPPHFGISLSQHRNFPPTLDSNHGRPLLLEDVLRPPPSFRVRSSVRILSRPLSASLLRLRLGHEVNGGIVTPSSSSSASMVSATSARSGACS
jgi:hypothetical protein